MTISLHYKMLTEMFHEIKIEIPNTTFKRFKYEVYKKSQEWEEFKM